MQILFLASEAVPFAKTGGLGDVAGILPKILAISENVSLIIPEYMTENIQKLSLLAIDSFPIKIGPKTFQVTIKKKEISQRLIVYFVSQELFFARKFLYGEASGAYLDNFYRFLFFQKAICEFICRQQLHFDIIHCNDWQTALIPLFIKLEPQRSFFAETKTVFTIHNLAYQGVFAGKHFKEMDLPESFFQSEYLEFFGNVSFMKAGIIFSDWILTVSPTYAREILSPEKGFGLDGLLRKFSFKLSGILNGVDYDQWNPEIDSFIDYPYSPHTLNEKHKNKQSLYAELGIKKNSQAPLLLLISRITEQKGMDLLLNLFPVLFKEDLYFIVLGQGDQLWTEKLQNLASQYTANMTFLNRFDEKMAQRLKAAADILFMPSLFEPCGLNQIYSMKYGTVPIVRSTGGLEDSVAEFDPHTRKGTGFKFRGDNISEIMQIIKNVLTMHKDQKLWRIIQRNGMAMNFSWDNAVVNYLNLYKKLKGASNHG